MPRIHSPLPLVRPRLWALAPLVLACLLAPSPARALGPYLFASLGGREVSDQDMADFFAFGSQAQPQFVPSYLGELYLTAGYRFTDPFAFEVAGGAQMGREESNAYSFGDVDLQVPTGALTELSAAPLFCFDTFESPTSTWLNQVGLRLEYAQVSGVESLDSGAGLSAQDFNGQAFGWGLFYRLVNLWAPSSVSMGLELGYESLRFGTLYAGEASGVFEGQGSVLKTLDGTRAFLDDSGPYLRLVVGWAHDSGVRRWTAVGLGGGPRQAGGAEAAAVLANARAAAREGDNAGALAEYRDYLGLRPEDAGAWKELGDLYRRFGQKDFAQRCYERAAALRPGR